jgi:hypothetical protein
MGMEEGGGKENGGGLLCFERQGSRFALSKARDFSYFITSPRN